MDSDNSISVSQALNQIQSWLNAGEYGKAVQGAGEILELEPGNQRALALMKLAEEKRRSLTEPSSTTSNFPSTSPNPAAEPSSLSNEPLGPAIDPLAHLQIEPRPNRFEPKPPQSLYPAENPNEKRQFFIAMLIPAVLVVLIGGSLIWVLAGQKRDDLLANNGASSVIDAPDTTYLKENDQRIDDMTKIADSLKAYKARHGSYPAVNQIENILVQSDFFDKIPMDPRQGEVDKAGKEFGYVYAVYSTFGKPNQTYVISALFEDSKGFGYPWTEGAPSKNYPDYRTVDEKHAIFLERP